MTTVERITSDDAPLLQDAVVFQDKVNAALRRRCDFVTTSKLSGIGNYLRDEGVSSPAQQLMMVMAAESLVEPTVLDEIREETAAEFRAEQQRARQVELDRNATLGRQQQSSGLG